MKYYTIHEMTEILGITAQTLRNWDKSEKLKPNYIGPNGYRYYSEYSLNQLLNRPINKTGEAVGYCRVSSPKQKDDLERQIEKIADCTRKNRAKANWIRLAEHNRIPIDCKYSNPRVTFDGLNWWISVGVEYEVKQERPTNQGVGIDIGIKDLAICSDKNTYKNINKSKKVNELKKKKRRLQRKVSRQYLKNKKGGSYCKASNIIKSEKQLLKLNHRLTNIRHNYLHQVTSEIVNRKPKFITLEEV